MMHEAFTESIHMQCGYLCDVSILVLPVLQSLLQVLFPHRLNGPDLELIVGQQLTKLL